MSRFDEDRHHPDNRITVKTRLLIGLAAVLSILAITVASARSADAAPIGQACAEELVRCSPVAAPNTTAGAFQGSLGWQAAGQQGVRGWHER